MVYFLQLEADTEAMEPTWEAVATTKGNVDNSKDGAQKLGFHLEFP